MLGIIIAPNRVEYCTMKKKDAAKTWFYTRRQLYRNAPEQLIAMDIYHDGAYVRSESVVIFNENNTIPYKCKFPERYNKNFLIAQLDEEKLVHEDNGGIFNNVKIPKSQRAGLIAGGLAAFVIAYGFIAGMFA